MNNKPSLQPEYDLTAHEIARINHGEVLQLQNDRLAEMNANHILYPSYVSPEESERLGVAGNSYNNLLDLDDNQEPAMTLFSEANRYAFGTKRLVERMYEEAYAANAYPSGPNKYFEIIEAQKAQETTSRSRVTKLLGTLTLHFINKDSTNFK